MKDSLGDRMKEQYENRTRYFLPRRTYTIIRIDGNAFHTLTKGMKFPFDKDLTDLMDKVCLTLCESIQGAKFGFVQSDEINILLTDLDDIKTEAWFNGNIQKMCSVSAAIATATFNEYSHTLFDNNNLTRRLAYFDSRVFTIPDPEEVVNMFIWRQQDATRNSISSAAQSVYSHKELERKNSNELQEMLHRKGINWNDYAARFKRGGAVKRVLDESATDTERAHFKVLECPIFTQERDFIKSVIPTYQY